ncbi:DUF6176 family protein [Breznakiella homolactica]|uniref:Uncharacterized protein n=1 Tax=Breznakiella homolactica TaxID=2798577 RepID=A0A7T8BA20_9SPIR|nr:DUF6176 family protein [Breznakiella homolactica]QQO07773.1 DUF6176 family protein [Breznakiella homolactica]
MDIKLYKLKVKKGKEKVAKEWLAFLKENTDQGSQLLKNEKAYLEAYFCAKESGTMYVYMFFAAEDVDYSNKTAKKSKSPLDEKHFAYMKECINLLAGDIMDCLFYMDNLEDLKT